MRLLNASKGKEKGKKSDYALAGGRLFQHCENTRYLLQADENEEDIYLKNLLVFSLLVRP